VISDDMIRRPGWTTCRGTQATFLAVGNVIAIKATFLAVGNVIAMTFLSKKF